ncbi:MAG: FlgD immunoglobulin-like domain containing protein [Elusimicrobiota bacterium]
MKSVRPGLVLALVLGASARLGAVPMSSPSYDNPYENVNSAGSVNTVSASYGTFADVGDTSGASASTHYQNVSGATPPIFSTFLPPLPHLPTAEILTTFPAFMNSPPIITGRARAYSGEYVQSMGVSVQNEITALYWNGTSFASPTPVFNPAPFIGASSGTWTFPTAPLQLANATPYQFQCQAIDTLSQVQTLLSTTSFIFDNVAPIATITFPLNNSILATNPTIAGGSYDPATPGQFPSGVAAVAVSLQDAVTGKCYTPAQDFTAACPLFLPTNGSTAAWTFTPAATSLIDGHGYVVAAQAVDNVGNVQSNFILTVSSINFKDASPFLAAPILLPIAGAAYANLPTITGAIIDNVAVASVTLSVQQLGGLCYSPASANFTAACPNQFPAQGTATAWSYSGIPWVGGQQYAVTATAKDPAGQVSSAASSFAFNVSTGQAGAPGDGQGTSALTPLTAGCQLVTATATFTAGPAGISPGGAIALHIPSGWTLPQGTFFGQPGYTFVVSTGGSNLEFNPVTVGNATLGADWVVYIATTSVTPGQSVQFVYQGYPGQGSSALFSFESAAAGYGNLTGLPSAQTMNLTPGPAAALAFVPATPLTLGPSQNSPSMQVQLLDACGAQTVTFSTAAVALSASSGGAGDALAVFSSTGSGGGPLNFLPFPVGGGATAPFTFKTSASPSLEELSANGALAGVLVSVQRPVNLLASGVALGGVSVDTGTLGTAASATIYENESSAGTAFINFTVSNPAVNWEVIVSSNPATFSPKLADFAGVGNPGRTLTWSGLNQQTSPPQFVSTGTYYVEIVAGGGTVVNTALTVTVAPTPSIYGTVTNGSGARVVAVGPNSSSGNGATAGPTGFFQILGLQSGASYLVSASSSMLIANSAVNVVASVGGVVPTAAGTSVGNLTFQIPSPLEFSAVLSAPSPADISGTIFVHDAGFAHTGSGTIHFFPGATASDNGAQAFGVNSSTWTTIIMPPGTYEADVALPSLGISTAVYGVTSSTQILLTKQANIYGYAVLPATAPANTWVSISAANPAGASVLGGVNVPVAASSAVYSLFGLSPGPWTVTAAAPGALPASVSTNVVGSSDNGSLATGGVNVTLKAGGVLSGTLTVIGNPLSVSMPAPCPNGAALCVPVTAYSPGNFFNGSTSVVLATSTTQTSAAFRFSGLPDGLYSVSAVLSGFTGPGQTVNVVSGSGASNITLTANNTKIFATVLLPPGVHPASDFKAVSLGCAGNQGTTLSFPDMTTAPAIQYFASSATVVLSGLNTDIYQFTAFNSATGMSRTVSASVANNSTAAVLLDLSGATYSVGGTLSLSANVAIPNSAGPSVTVSSVPGLLANTGRLSYCLLGYSSPPSMSAAHLELLPANSAGAFIGGPLQTVGAGCPGNLISPGTTAGAVSPNPYLAYVATVAVNGSFSFPGVPPGVYLLRNNSQLDASGDRLPQFTQTVVVNSAVSGLVFQLGAGYTVSGSVLTQSGVLLSRSMSVNLMNGQGQLAASAPVVFSNSGSASFSFTQVVNGNYTLVLQDSAYPKAYAAAPLPLQVAGQNLAGQNLSVLPSGTIKCKVAIQEPLPGGGFSSRLIAPGNVGLLPGSFQIQAAADPWFSGGLGAAGGPSAPGVPTLDANGEFVIDGLLPGSYDAKFLAASGGAGTLPLVNRTVPGIAVTANNVSDIGVVDLSGGTQVIGMLSDASSGAAVANLRVHGAAALRGSGVATQAADAVTDGNGRYVLASLDPTVRFYDVYAAYRGVEVQGESLPPYEQTISPSVDVSTVSSLNFKPAPAVYSVAGRVQPAAGGPALSVPTAGGQTAQAALVYFQKAGVIPVSNPIADIQFQTDFNGNFTIPSLTTGTYRLTATSLGYASLSQLVTISTASVNVGALTMIQGATLTGSLTNPDGSNPSVNQVAQILAVTPDMSNVLIGSLLSNPNTQAVSAYTISGFKTGLMYRVILLDSQNGITSPPEAAAVVFRSTATMTLNIVNRPSPPLVIAASARQGSGFQLEFDMSQPLRTLTASDNNLPAILSPVSAAGSLTSFALSQDRTRLTSFYTPAISESSFTLHLRGYSTVVNPNSTDPINPQFLSESTVTFYTGIDGLGQTNVANLEGGDVFVQGDNGRVTLPPGSFNVAVTSSVQITLQVANESLAGGAPVAGLPPPLARLKALRYGPSAYPSEIVAAAAAVPPSVSPLSAFYNIFLPLGVSNLLAKPAQLTVSYSSGADPSSLNFYWFNPAISVYDLQPDVTGAAPVINTADHTITINVNHFSTYVLFDSAQPVISGGGGAQVLQVDNFPNPFDQSLKTVTPLHEGGGTCGTSCAIVGTMIGVSLPPDLSGGASIRIFNVAGTLVRSIDLGALQGGTYFYQNWDGTNDYGRPVASGAYIGELKIGGRTKFFRMAVIKGSGQ